MPHQINLEKTSLEEIQAFLAKVGESNESTEYSTEQEYVVNGIIALARIKGRTAIIEDFETPYIHPLITIQKWIDELKLIADEALNDMKYGDRHALFKKKISDMNGYDVTQFINYLRQDGLLK